MWNWNTWANKFEQSVRWNNQFDGNWNCFNFWWVDWSSSMRSTRLQSLKTIKTFWIFYWIKWCFLQKFSNKIFCFRKQSFAYLSASTRISISVTEIVEFSEFSEFSKISTIIFHFWAIWWNSISVSSLYWVIDGDLSLEALINTSEERWSIKSFEFFETGRFSLEVGS